ncbi:hypothetical protein Q4E93_14745 [Flavitalea sp. BT771]|uniref:hypothetical protein n=1 Tax=Flavitalea sp. BT771 TaxID=3063329 RepID=UPI0026E12576|nr:hypothetical protein [Flavitalea sp. BT771]MDO6431861.1 hypothetical protein [Flavitalea sp. BT771]MDV6220770.1 hypothetical protein [Flavitalea sp. BT771]
MKKRSIIRFLALCCFFCVAVFARGQQINLDKPVRAGELTLFPDITNEMVYYYVSDKPHLAKDANGKPQFSFLRYVSNATSAADQPAATEGDGGGIVHAVVELSVTQDQIREAQRALQRIRSGATIQGPVVYKSGKFGIVSSFKDPQGGLSKQVVGLGNAPILDNEKAAVSIQLTKQGAKILWESFKTTAPDISFTFEMEITGYRSPKKAVIEANFDQIYDHKAFAVGLASTYLAAEIKGAFDDLVKSGAIKVTQVGEDEKMEALITTAYNKIADMMFSPLNGSGTPGIGDLTAAAGGQSSLLDRATTMLRNNREEAARNNAASGTTTPGGPNPGTTTPATTATTTRAPNDSTPPTTAARIRGDAAPAPPAGSTAGNSTNNRAADNSGPAFAIVATFEMKHIHQQGTFKIDLNKSTADNLDMRFDENIGDLTSFMNDPTVFRQANLDDPLYIQRELTAFVDGMNAQDFGQFVNFVNLRMKKTHESGDVTNQEVRIDRNNFNKEGNNFKMVYGYKGDNDRKKWMDYEYEAEWSFFGGQSVSVPLQKSTSGAIDLAPPYQKRSVEFTADPTAVSTNGIRLITVKLFYTLNGNELSKVVTLNPSKSQLSEKVDFLLPADSFDYKYQVEWKLNNNQTRSSDKVSAHDAIVFVDAIPNA